ncbi:hypothetical protein A55_4403, partial [Vibrio cholerae 1587]
MVVVVVFEFSVMRCQPLRRALGIAHLVLRQMINKVIDNLLGFDSDGNFSSKSKESSVYFPSSVSREMMRAYRESR